MIPGIAAGVTSPVPGNGGPRAGGLLTGKVMLIERFVTGGAREFFELSEAETKMPS
jgi:hypothetical protein